MRKAPTIRDIAEGAGVSVAVVSRVLNQGSGPVAPATREKVVAVMDRLGYRPRAAARQLSSGQAGLVGLILTDLTNPFFARLADRVAWEARARGVHVVLITTQEDPHLEGASLDVLLDRSLGGVIATPTGGNTDRWNRLMELGVQVVFVDRTIEDLPGVDTVSIGNAKSAETATQHLIDLGHERIALISGPLSTSTGRSRIFGYECALQKNGIQRDLQLVHPIAFSGDGGESAVTAVLELSNPPSALVVANTAQVRNALRRLAQSSISVPSELSVIVFDDNPWTELVTPALSVVRQPIERLAVHSLDLVLGRMRGRLPEPRRSIVVDAEFVVRSSTAPPASSSRLP